MPYIKQVERERFDKNIEELFQSLWDEESEFQPRRLAYIVFSLIQGIVDRKGIKYTLCNNIVGALECVRQEFHRRKFYRKGEVKIVVENTELFRREVSKNIEELLVQLCNEESEFQPGQLNYIVSKLIKGIVGGWNTEYCATLCSDTIKFVIQEFYKKIVVPYEDKKIIENGDI